MHLLQHKSLAVLFAFVGTAATEADSLSISGSNLSTIFNSSNVRIAAGSIIQVGHFLGLNPADIDPSGFGAAEWNTFTPITGPGSPNPSLTASIEDVGSFVGIYRLSVPNPSPPPSSLPLTIDGDNGGNLPPFPSIMGVRIFDTTNADNLGSAEFNTVSTTLDSWIATGPDGLGGTGVQLGLFQNGTDGNPDAYWQFSNNPFQTVIPEPSSSILMVLGSLALLSARRREK